MANSAKPEAFDPFSAFLTGGSEKKSSAETTQALSAEELKTLTEPEEEVKAETEVGGTGGGWGDADDDDLDIE